VILNGQYVWGTQSLHPSFFSALNKIDGYFTIYEAIRAYELAFLVSPRPLIEIGSYKGRSTFCWAIGAACKDPAARVYSIDKAHDPTFEPNMISAGVRDFIHVCRGDSVEIGKGWPLREQNPGLIFIDGSHDYQDVRADFKTWIKALGEGGNIALHDAGGFWPGPTQVAQEEIIGNDRFTDVRVVDSLIHARMKRDDEP
jgi:predicted O-methyltransferase YrrM